jgi:hypothetical protein
MRDFQAVVDAYPTATVADDALLEIARYQLSVARDYDKAQGAIETLLKRYPTGDAAAFAYVLDGELALRRGRQAPDVDRAIGNFQRVPRLFPASDAVPVALLAHADTLRILNDCAAAAPQYDVVRLHYPRSRQAHDANVGASRCQVANQQPVDAIVLLQQGARTVSDPAAITRVRALNGILYRLYLRAPQPPFAYAEVSYAGVSGRMRDVTGVAVHGDLLHTVTGNGVGTLDLAKNGAAIASTKLENARGVFIDRDGKPVSYSSRSITGANDRALPLAVMKPDKTPRMLEDITAVAMLSTGELLVADGDGPLVHRFAADLKALGPRLQTRAHRLAVNSVDQIAALDRSERTITLWWPDSKPGGRIATRGPGWQLDEPTDIAFDFFDHLYVLDRGSATVLVFALTPQIRLIASFSLPERAPGAFRRAAAMALDASGRLFIYDDRAERIQVYQ